MRRRAPRTAFITLGLLALAGCAGTHAGIGPQDEGPTEIALTRSMVVLPEALATERLAVRQRVESMMLQERVVLANATATPGENAILVQTRWRGTALSRIFVGPFETPYTADTIERRAREAFGAFAEIGPLRERENRHGPHAYLAAEGEGVRCVLAWQILERRAEVTGDPHPYAVELRYCDPERGPKELLALFDQVDLDPYL